MLVSCIGAYCILYIIGRKFRETNILQYVSFLIRQVRVKKVTQKSQQIFICTAKAIALISALFNLQRDNKHVRSIIDFKTDFLISCEIKTHSTVKSSALDLHLILFSNYMAVQCNYVLTLVTRRNRCAEPGHIVKGHMLGYAT